MFGLVYTFPQKSRIYNLLQYIHILQIIFENACDYTDNYIIEDNNNNNNIEHK